LGPCSGTFSWSAGAVRETETLLEMNMIPVVRFEKLDVVFLAFIYFAFDE
jgi:hypothetical protein